MFPQWGNNPLAQTKPGYLLGTKLYNNIVWEEEYFIYCQAQPKPQFNWAELALLSHFDLNLLILLRFFTRESIGLFHLAVKLNQISFLALVYECLSNGASTP